MRIYNRSNLLFSIHIPKCGGTSFTKVLRRWFLPSFHAHYYDHQHHKMPPKPRWFKTVGHALGIYPMCVHGHFEEECSIEKTYPDANQFITVIRDPLEMQLSLFFDHKRRLKEEGGLFWKGKRVEMEYGGDIDAWVEQRPSYLLKFFPWEINLNNYKQVINEHFIHIGTTEQLQNSVDILANKLGKKSHSILQLNKSPRTEKPSKSSINIFQEKHHLEYAIYQYIYELNR